MTTSMKHRPSVRIDGLIWCDCGEPGYNFVGEYAEHLDDAIRTEIERQTLVWLAEKVRTEIPGPGDRDRFGLGTPHDSYWQGYAAAADDVADLVHTNEVHQIIQGGEVELDMFPLGTSVLDREGLMWQAMNSVERYNYWCNAQDGFAHSISSRILLTKGPITLIHRPTNKNLRSV